MPRSRSRSRSRDKRAKSSRSERDRDKGRERDRDGKDREGKDRERERDRDRDKERRDRERDRERGSKRRRSRSRSRGRTPDGEGDHRRSSRSHRDSGHRSQQDLASLQPKQPQEQQGGLPQQPTQQGYASTAEAAAVAAATAAAAALSQQEAAEKRRNEEQAGLDAEIEQRRKKVEEWRAKKLQEQGLSVAAAAAEKEALVKEEAAAADAAAAGGQDTGWSFEDDDDDDAGAADAGAVGEVDPLDAFMQGTEATLAGPVKTEQGDPEGKAGPVPAMKVEVKTEEGAAAAAAGIVSAAAAATANGSASEAKTSSLHSRWGDRLGRRKFGDGPLGAQPLAALDAAAAAIHNDEEVDPLDAFMAAEVLPQARAAAATAAAEEAAAAAAVTAAATAATRPTPKAEPDDGMGADATAHAHTVANGEAGPAGEDMDGATAKAMAAKAAVAAKRKKLRKKRRNYGSDTSSESESNSSEDSDDAEWARAVTAGKASKADRLFAVDHSKITYKPFRKNFYIAVPELARMAKEEVVELRKELDGIKVAGANAPTPIRSFAQAGLNAKVLDILKLGGFERPLPIQAQAIPVIMSGRDCIGVAKTGSGKTLAFVLPMLRHVKDQPPMEATEGPVALIMAPTRELVQQISKEIKKFARMLHLEVVAVFGGSGVASQISELKRGCDIVVCTPGRMIDLLVTSNGKITNMRRVTFLVLDEADRMFDMGFEPQIGRIVQNIRPDRQTVLFSATFPRQVEALARKILTDPIEIQVGGRSVVNSDIAQVIEIRPEAERFLRLLEILGEWYDRGKILIFVHSQENCDNLFRELLKHGYPCLSLHGGKDQSDRECTVKDFKGNVCNILVATSVAARGLDVKELVLVVNYDVPNHHEDYVHRVGRTGRAGAKGTAITFIGPDEERYAPDLVKALRESSAPVPQDLVALANVFNEKRKQGLVQGHGSGYGGSGFKFDLAEADATKAQRKEKAKELGFGGEEASAVDQAGFDSDGAGAIRPATQQNAMAPIDAQAQVAAAIAAAQQLHGQMGIVAGAARPAAPAALAALTAPQSIIAAAAQKFAAALSAQAGVPNAGGAGLSMPQAGTAASALGSFSFPSASGADPMSSIAARAAAIAASLVPAGHTGYSGSTQQPQAPSGFEAELEINDFPQHSRWKVTHKDSMSLINELTGAAVTTRGTFVPPGKAVPPGERKIYLLIEGPTELSVKRAKQEIKRILEETTEKVLRRDGAPAPGRYSVM